MCGRFVLHVADHDWQPLAARFALSEGPPLSRFNLAPTQAAAAIVASAARGGPLCPALQPLSFGIQAGAIGLVINARAETVTERPLFRGLLAHHRVLLVATGFFEWAPARHGSARKRPYLFARPNGAPFCFAALRGAQSQQQGSAVIVTTTANEVVAPIHQRMPVMLDLDAAERWLDPATDMGDALDLLRPYAGALNAWPVGLAVNNVRNDTPDCIDPIAAD